jgi:hypothetical protein
MVVAWPGPLVVVTLVTVKSAATPLVGATVAIDVFALVAVNVPE